MFKRAKNRSKIPIETLQELDNIVNCQKCGRHVPPQTPERMKHHVKPLEEGGTNDPENLMIVCIDCHYKIHEHLMKRKGIYLFQYRSQVYDQFSQTSKKGKTIRKIHEKAKELRNNVRKTS